MHRRQFQVRDSGSAREQLAGDSRPVRSNQRFTHPRLPALVRRHQRAPSRRPVAGFNQAAYARLAAALERQPKPLVLDSFCGTGHSTAQLAARYPDHWVVGIDKSAHRLARHPQPEAPGGPANYLLLRAECEAIWQLLVAGGQRLEAHYLLYPNPWPKSTQLGRRIQGNAAFPFLLQLGGALELRSNWPVYVEEFGLAVTLGGGRGAVSRCDDGAPPLTLFERKYRASGQLLWRFQGHCPDTGRP